MQSVHECRARIVQANRDEYGAGYDRLKWPSDREARRATEERSSIIASLEPLAPFHFKETKPASGALSPGCEICGEGSWSCLFINGRCNCRCFYCPTAQNHIDIPTTNAVQFPRAKDYVDYIEVFRFRGVGISGGEPLITFDRTLSYLTVLKEKFGDRVYVWLYTNGTLLNEDRLLSLRDAGLDEIRFDSSATGYEMRNVGLAARTIPTVTVEVPAIPEDFELLKKKVVEMRESGVRFLNLHQLRLTPYNYSNLSARPYTFLHGEKVTVLESELAALSMIKYVAEHKIGLPVNYCSFVYKHRFQRAAARTRNAFFVRNEHEHTTENGYIRYLCLVGNAPSLARQAAILSANGCSPDLWRMTDSGDRLYFSASLWDDLDFKGLQLLVGYYVASFRSSPTYHNSFREIRLNSNKTVTVEKGRIGREFELAGDKIALFEKYILRGDGEILNTTTWEDVREIASFEFITPGLQEYY